MTKWLPTILALALFAACGTTPAPSDVSPAHDASAAADADETPIPLADVPAHVRAAALAALPGFAPTAAEIEREDGVDLYEIEGFVGDELWEVEVTPAGEVLEVEREDDDEDDDED